MQPLAASHNARPSTRNSNASNASEPVSWSLATENTEDTEEANGFAFREGHPSNSAKGISVVFLEFLGHP